MNPRNVSFAVLLFALLPASIAAADQIERSFSELLAAQGTFCLPDGEGGCFNYMLPLPNLITWYDPEHNRSAVVDYVGLADAWVTEHGGAAIGTTVSGFVTEQDATNGYTEYVVQIDVERAVVWVVEGYDLSSGPIIFGRRVEEIAGGAPPSLANASLKVRFLSRPAYVALPDLIQTLFWPAAQVTMEIGFRARGDGELRSASGEPDGTGGRVYIKQTADFTNNQAKDPFKAEIIIVK